MEIKPDRKLLTKYWWILTTCSVTLLLVAVILQVIIPEKEEMSSGEIAILIYTITLGLILLTWIISVPLLRLWVKNLTFYIEEDRISIHKGILTKIQQNIPYRKVTDFRLKRSLYDRWIGIGAIQIQTAGQSPSGTGFEGALPGLVNWDELLSNLRGKIDILHKSAQSGAVDPVKTVESEDTNKLILEELRAIRKALENR